MQKPWGLQHCLIKTNPLYAILNYSFRTMEYTLEDSELRNSEQGKIFLYTAK